MSNNNSNWNYLEIIPSTPSTPSYQPAQQFPQQQQYPQQEQQMIGPNGQVMNISELDKSMMRFEKGNPIYDFGIIKAFLPKTLDDYYSKYFAYLETIKQRRGMEEYLSDLRKILNKMNEYISKTEQSIIKLKKTLDYTESTIPIQSQFQPTINGKPPTPNIFIIPELQNIVEKDNNIDFVDIFGLKGKNISYIPLETRNLMVIIVQSLMGFNPQISLDPRVNAKLNNCLNILKYQIIDYSINSVANTDKLSINDKDPEFKPLVKIDIYSKLFDIFNKGSINIKDIKTDKISERIETPPERSSSPSYSPTSFSYGGSPDYSSFGGPKRNNEQKSQPKSQPGNSKQNISTKIKTVLKYEIGSTNSGNTQIEIERTVRKKGQEMTEYLFNNKDIQEQLRDIKVSNNKNNKNKQQTGGENKKNGKNDKGKRTGSTEIKELTGNSIINLLKNQDSKYASLREALKKGVIDKFLENLRPAYRKKKEDDLTQSKREALKNEKKKLEDDVKTLTQKLKTDPTSLSPKDKKDINKDIAEKEKRIKVINSISNPDTKYSDSDFENIVIYLNEYLKGIIEKYKTRILYRAEESFGNEKCSIIDFFTGTQDMVKISGSYTRNKKNDEKKSITYIQIYMMMYEAYKEYYKTYSIETIIKSFTKDTIKTDYDLKMRILNGLGLYLVIIYKQLKIVRERIKNILQQSNPDFEKAKGMLLKVQTLINSSPDEEKKEKLLKMKKNIEEQINKLSENSGHEKQYKNRGDFGEKKGFDKNSKPYNKPYGDKKYKNQGDFGEKKPYNKPYVNKRYTKSYNNNVSL